jgi:hypothetical protein
MAAATNAPIATLDAERPENSSTHERCPEQWRSSGGLLSKEIHIQVGVRCW